MILLAIAVLGVVTGLLSGLLGIGGGIVLAPLLLYAPPLAGLEPLSMRTVAGLTIIQALAASVSGGLTHRRSLFVSDRLAAFMGPAIVVAAAIGGVGAKFVPNRWLLAVFGAMALVAGVLMLVPLPDDREKPDLRDLTFNRSRAISTATGVGLLGGLVGQGGSFLLIPLMTSFVRIPTRIAIGSNLAIVLLASASGFLGKAFTGQIEWLLALPLVLAALPAAYVGGRISHRVPVARLRKVLAVLIVLAAARIWISVVSF